jgi:hypothetical protein
MGKIVINSCYGGFGLSDKAMSLIRQKGLEVEYHWDIQRSDPRLVDVVEFLGEEANGLCAKLEIIEVEPGRKFIIDEYDGYEGLMFADEVDWIVLDR